jgi:hypothetical protein
MQRLAFLVWMALAGTCLAQDSAAQKPTQLPPPELSLSNVKLVKLSEDKKSLAVIAPKTRSETQTRLENKVEYLEETRTRVVTANGKQVAQDYVVKVPVSTMVEQTYTVEKLESSYQFDIPLEKLRAWRLDGTLLKAEQLQAACAKPVHMIVVETKEQTNFSKVDPFFASVLRPETIVVYYSMLSPQ